MPLTQQQLVEEAQAIARTQVVPGMDAEAKDALLETTMMRLLDAKVAVPFFGRVGVVAAGGAAAAQSRFLMHDEPRLPRMPEKPTLIDFFKHRFTLARRGGSHLLQSGMLAKRNGLPDKIVLACLLHDIAVVSFIRTDHGYYGAQLIEPYVDEEVAWAIRYHQALRFYADPANGYEYPELYTRAFGDDYVPPPYVAQAAEHARGHKWYMSARLVTMNDLYSFDPNARIDIMEFEDLIGRNFRQPKEGLGFDDSPVAHMWRSIIWPNNFL